MVRFGLLTPVTHLIRTYVEFVTSGFAFKAASNCLTSSGGDILSISAPSIDKGTLTPVNCLTISVETKNHACFSRMKIEKKMYSKCVSLVNIIKQNQRNFLKRKKILKTSHLGYLPKTQMKDVELHQHGCKHT